MRPPALVLTAALILIPAAARATASPPSTTATASIASAEPVAEVDPGVLTDPNIDRGFLTPTAETQPAGTFTLTSYELALVGATVGLTDRLQLSVIALLPELGEGGPERAWAATIKWQVLRRGLLRLSVMGGMGYEEEGLPEEQRPADRSDPRRRTYNPLLGTVGSVCLTLDCHSMFSLNTHLRGIVGAQGWRRTEALVSASLALRLAERWKLIVEYVRAVKLQSDPVLRDPAVTVGIRVFRRGIAVELGSLMVLDRTVGLAGLPYASLGVRF